MGISKLRKMLHDSIQKFGLNSKKTYELSLELDEEIIKYYKDTNMLDYYKESLDGLKTFIKENGREPTAKEWNKYAFDNNYLSSESLKYIGNIVLKK